jgi:manganese/zinc/iron transport system permease protein
MNETLSLLAESLSTSHSWWIILTGALVATCCAIIGCFMVLKGIAMIGDAISHAVLPGIVLAFLFTGSRATLPMLIGASAVGVLSSFFIDTLHRKARLQADASIGITFTWLFAVGVILISIYANNIDLDQDCVLYGEIAYVPLDIVSFSLLGLKLSIPYATIILTLILIAVVGLIFTFYKEFVITTFDPALAKGMGMKVGLWHYIFMGCVALTTVSSFESVGAIIVVALFVAPPASAYLLTERLPSMIALAVVFGILTSLVGYPLAIVFDSSISGAMALIAGLEVIIAVILSSNIKRNSGSTTIQVPTPRSM